MNKMQISAGRRELILNLEVDHCGESLCYVVGMTGNELVVDLYNDGSSHRLDITDNRTGRSASAVFGFVLTEMQVVAMDTALGLTDGRRVFDLETRKPSSSPTTWSVNF